MESNMTWMVLDLIRSRRVGRKVGPTRGLGKSIGLIAVRSPYANELERIVCLTMNSLSDEESDSR